MKKEAEAIEAVAARLATIANSVDEASGGAQGVFAARIISELIRGPNKALDHRLYELEQAFWRRAAELTRKPRKRRKR